MSFFLCNAKVNSNYCVGDKDKRQKKSYRNHRKDSEVEKLQHNK